MRAILVFLLLLVHSRAAATSMPDMTAANGYIEPFQMFDEVYYVGDKWVSSYLIKISAGLVLIDTLDFPYSKWIPVNISKLQLDSESLTHIIITHGHSDHAGGAQYLQSRYDADVLITEHGLKLAHQQSEKSQHDATFLPPKVQGFVTDNSSIQIGNTRFSFYITPGHTQGDLSVDFIVTHASQRYRAFVIGGHSVNFQQPDLAKQFFESMARIKKLASSLPAVTVNLANHPHKNNLFTKQRDSVSKDTINPFVSRNDVFTFIQQQEDLAKNEAPKRREAESFMPPPSG